MKYLSIFLFLSIVFVGLPGCKDKEETTGVNFDATFKATYDGNQFEVNKDYVYGAFPVSFLRYRLYLCDITLLKNDGTETRLSEVEYLDFTPDSNPSNVSVTPKITFANVPAGSYDGIRMGFGVRPDLNAKQPADYPNGTPLNIETDYWAGWKSYIFMVLDGKADPDNDGTKNLAFSYHCGSDPVYQTFTFTQHIHVEEGHAGINVEFDVRKLLTNDDSSMYDIVTNPNTSNSVNDTRVAKEIVGHYGKATTIKQ